MSVPAQEPITQHTGNGVTTSFAYQFLLTLVGDIQVSVNGVSRVINTDYTLTGLGSPAGGTITFNAAPPSGASILFVRAVALQRDTNYQYAGDFQAKTVNDDFDRLWMAKQDLYELTKRSIKLPPSDGPAQVVLPQALVRANKALVFDEFGAVSVSQDDYNDQAANVATQAQIATAQAQIAAAQAGDASASAASALDAQTAINHKYRGALGSDPATRTDGAPNQAGDEYFNTLLSRKKVFNGTGWYLPEDPLVAEAIDSIKAFNPRGAWATGTAYALKDVYTSAGIAYVAVIAHTSTSVAADLAAGKVTVHQGATREDLAMVDAMAMFGYSGPDVQALIDEAKPMQTYAALRAYTGRATGIRITTPGVAGLFQRDSDTTAADNGGTVIVDASSRRWKRLISGDVNVLWFGATGNGVADDTASENAALLFCATSGHKTLFYPVGIYRRTAPYAFTATHAGFRFQGAGKGKAIVKMMYAGALGTVVNCQHLSASGMVFDGNCETYPANRGFVFSGTSHYPAFDDTVVFFQFADAAFEFGPDSGFRANISPVIFSTGLADYCAIRITGPDTTAMFRNLSGTSANGRVEVTGGYDTTFNSGFCTRMVISSTSSITKSIGTIWGAGAVPIVIDGQNTIIQGCRLAQSVTLNVGMTGTFSGNIQTVAGFTNNTLAGNVLIHHHQPAASFENLGKHSYSIGVTAAEFALHNVNSVGDVNYTWLPDNSPSFLTFSADLTANRTITLTTTNARAGMVLRVSRNGGNTGGPWTLGIGGTGKALSAGQWCDVIFNGSFWLVTASGSL